VQTFRPSCVLNLTSTMREVKGGAAPSETE